MTAGALRQSLIAAEVAALRQKYEGLHLDERPQACRALLYRLQGGGTVKVPRRLVLAALDIPLLDCAPAYLITGDDELVPLDAQGTPRADYTLPAAAAAAA